MVRTLAWMKKATPDEIVAKLPADFSQNNPAVYRKALESNLPSFSPDGLMPTDAPGNVLEGDGAVRSGHCQRQGRHDRQLTTTVSSRRR